MNEWPGDPGEHGWHLSWSRSGAIAPCYRPPRCTMATVKDHSTLTLGAIHSAINRKIIHPLIADHTNQFHFSTMKCSQIRGCDVNLSEGGMTGDPWSECEWGTAPAPGSPRVRPVSLMSVWFTSAVMSQSISCPNSLTDGINEFLFYSKAVK